MKLPNLFLNHPYLWAIPFRGIPTSLMTRNWRQFIRTTANILSSLKMIIRALGKRSSMKRNKCWISANSNWGRFWKWYRDNRARHMGCRLMETRLMIIHISEIHLIVAQPMESRLMGICLMEACHMVCHLRSILIWCRHTCHHTLPNMQWLPLLVFNNPQSALVHPWHLLKWVTIIYLIRTSS